MRKELRELLSGGGFGPVSKQRSEIMRAVKSKGNSTTEIRLRFALVRAGVKGWEMHPRGFPGKPDFIFRRARVAVFVDGCFWHGCRRCGHIPRSNSSFWAAKIDSNRKRDRVSTRLLRYQCFIVMRFWEHEIKNDLQTVVHEIREKLKNR
jgi:DNA mismatch endonuclease (patch repair protein)